ncbi:DUF805 domain-containing protein [Phenylobacterium sp.]|uniref:DUF805 domain-containing protein n=1 Tax=Phenylobacterium sp. TaxID=1871053 RepID=UPI002734D0EE|nr:DUF805 domain-containing protein [Phenylobacterium sp.]MDP3658600.1 DUF805 domain-containing protein [Phenylobacterium sp.]
MLNRFLFAEGRADRREYWLVAAPLVVWITSHAIYLETRWPEGPADGEQGFAGFLFRFFVAFPFLISIVARRLHDLGHSILLVSAIMPVVLIVHSFDEDMEAGWLKILLVSLQFAFYAAGLLTLGLLKGQQAENEHRPPKRERSGEP